MSARSDLIAACLDGEAAEYLTGARNWRADLSPSIAQGDTWDRAGLEALVISAAAEAGIALPYNFASHGPWLNFRKAGWHTARRDEMVSAAARMAGWLRSAAQYPLLRTLISRTMSERGMGSPSTMLDLWSLAVTGAHGRRPGGGPGPDRAMRPMSPGGANRFIGAVIRRADAILYPAGARVSWRGVAMALGQSRRVGRAALIAAASTLRGEGYDMTYREARETMIQLCRTVRSRMDSTDGVIGHTIGKAVISGGCKVRELIVHGPRAEGSQRTRRHPMMLITRRDGRSYHWDECWYRTPYNVDSDRSARCVRAATDAWAAQDDAARSLPSALGRTDISILVTREDSYAAGNCEPGTEAYLRGRGWGNRWYVPAAWAIASGEHRALNAAVVAAQRLP